MKKYFFSMIAALLMITVAAWASTPKEAKIKTNAHCENCKTKIEQGLNKVDGVSYSNLDLKTKIVTVRYDAEKTSPEKLKTAIVDLGYNADKVKAKSAGNCCKDGSGKCSTKSKSAKDCNMNNSSSPETK